MTVSHKQTDTFSQKIICLSFWLRVSKIAQKQTKKVNIVKSKQPTNFEQRAALANIHAEFFLAKLVIAKPDCVLLLHSVKQIFTKGNTPFAVRIYQSCRLSAKYY